MLPIPKDRVATQECVGEQVTNKEVEIWDQSPTFAVDKKIRAGQTAEPTKQDQRAPIKMVSGCAWSLGIYRALRLLGKFLDVAYGREPLFTLSFLINNL